MVMTPQQMIELFSQQARMHWAAIAPASQAGNYELLKFNLSSTLDCHLMVALLEWRQNANPRESLLRVCEVADSGMALLNQVGPGLEHWKGFDVFPSAFCGALLGKTIAVPSRQVLLAWQENRVDYLSQCLDACIVELLAKGEPPTAWSGLIAGIENERRLELTRTTYTNYADIALKAAGNLHEAIEAVRASTALFKRRKVDGYYAGGRGTDGGGPDNPLVIDYRLAALLHLCLPDFAAELDSEAGIHAWRW
jgi:hypothetical protein